MGTGDTHHCFFPLTSLQIGDLQSYRSYLNIFLACESDKLFILVDNRPWLIDLDSRAAYLWQLMITKSRLSPFANTKARREQKDDKNRLDVKDKSRLDIRKPKKFERWNALINVATLSQKKALLPIKNLKKSMLLISELHRTLSGFIIFEVAWANVRGISYINELQTDTSFAIEAKFMKRWEFDSIQQASNCISSWFSGTNNERLMFQDYLDSIIGEVFYDAEEDFLSSDPTDNGESVCNDDDCVPETCDDTISSDFSVYPASLEHKEGILQTPPPPTLAHKTRKINESTRSPGQDTSSVSVSEMVCTSTNPETGQNTFDPTNYRDVLILFRFNDRDLPFKLRDIILPNLRLLTLLEAGLPSWVIFLQSYPVFCHLYRPWMCPLVRALYVLISVVTVLIGFYDLYKNVPVLKATASRICGPLFDWIETWEMISRIKYLGTMLFLHNFEKAVKFFLMFTRAVRSFFSVLTQPMAGPFVDIIDIVLPLWNICLETFGSLYSVIWISVGSSFGLVLNAVEIVFFPMWSIVSAICSAVSSIIYPIYLALYELLYSPLRLLLAMARFVACVCLSTFDVLREVWLSLSGLFQIAATTEATVSTYEISMWRSLWNDLFSQIFRAVRSIINGLISFFAACNRHRLSIYHHTQDYLRRFSYMSTQTYRRWKRKGARSPTAQLEYRRKIHFE